ncbi:MAG TPA: recombination mediator RecR [Rickettsiales bacterium]|nr:recombination mediator RecR [Rickettsiales bacterium]
MTTSLDSLISLFAKLPGLGPRSARRVVLHLVRNREKLLGPLAASLAEAGETIRDCSICGNLDVSDPCNICSDERRDKTQICVVEEVADLWAIERSGMFRGGYHVLGGVLSALDGKGPDQLNIDSLVSRASSVIVGEVILATNATVEGQTTAHYISDRLANSNVRISRLAHGIPIGGELDYLDDGTLGAALKARIAV